MKATTLPKRRSFMKLPVRRTGLPGNEFSFHIVPLDPAFRAGLAGHLPVRIGEYSSGKEGGDS
jgi:hypothetical protein